MSIHKLSIVSYPLHSGWVSDDIIDPSWEKIEQEIRSLDDEEFPYVELYRSKDDEDPLMIMGGLTFDGDTYFTLFSLYGDWHYLDESQNDINVRFWKRDQGYVCSKRNTLTDIDRVLLFARDFFKHGSFERLGKMPSLVGK